MNALFIALVTFAAVVASDNVHADELQFGFSKVDITPTTPLRLSGYASRKEPFAGVDEKLFARAMVFKKDDVKAVLVSVETIGFKVDVTKAILDKVKPLGFSREQVSICMTHCHSAPHISGGLGNLFQPPLTEQQQKNTDSYSASLIENVSDAVAKAVGNLQPGKMSVNSGEVLFARHRRVIQDGLWKTFGENGKGPVDHSLPVVRITDPSGGKVLGVIFNYACHCTTFGGKYNRLNGDWAGYAQKYLEEALPGATALCTIGCGADANPQRDEDKALALAKSQGKLISDEVSRLLKLETWKPVATFPQTNYGFAGLAHERPSKDDLNKALDSSNPHVRRHAQVMLETWRRMGRLPETYPMPIQVWRFGDEFAMAFLGGEVVVEYAQRIKKEIAAASEIPTSQIWVSAYANDVFGYVASERMRSEGGYEVDFSMIYYLLPGRWASGTEDVIIKRVKELFDSKAIAKPKSVEEAVSLFSLPSGFEIEPVATEPLVEDPINFAVDAKGRLWVVEMGDYPQGADGKVGPRTENPNKQPWDGEPGGRVKILTDSDGDGVYDSASVFLDGLVFPTGVFPWRNGAIISGAPDIFYAEDKDGDGKADFRKPLYTGFVEANPQHRINGFEYGLDGWLYLSSGGSKSKEITCVKTGEKLRLSGRDLRIHPESGKAEPVSGDTQYGRCRDEFNRWFGNTNSEPLYQMVIDDKFVERNPYIQSPPPKHYLTNPILNPPVYPTSRTLDRFNDLHTSDRFSSACAPLVFRNNSLGTELQNSALICEPVHNLISRVKIRNNGVAVSAERFDSESNREFLTSTDNWFRPVRQMTGPDGGLWICDMYRHVIEHPEWIPESWQASLDLYAGSNLGRIYRVTKSGQKLAPVKDFTILEPSQLVDELKSSNGWVRDIVQQRMVELNRVGQVKPAQVRALVAIALNPVLDPRVRIQVIWICALIAPTELRLSQFAQDSNPQVVVNAIRALGLEESENANHYANFATSSDPAIQFEFALAANDLGELKEKLLRQLLEGQNQDPWVRAAAMSSAVDVSSELLNAYLVSNGENLQEELLANLINTTLADKPKQGFATLVAALMDAKLDQSDVFAALDVGLTSIRKRGIRLSDLESDSEYATVVAATNVQIEKAVELSQSEDASEVKKCVSIKLMGHASSNTAESRSALLNFLMPQESPVLQQLAVVSLAQLGATETLVSELAAVGPSTQSKIQSVLLARPEFAHSLLKGIESESVKPAQLQPSTIEALLNYQDTSVREKASELFESTDGVTRGQLLEDYQVALGLDGNRESGKAIFLKQCASCHKLNGIGQDVGPGLEALASKDRSFVLKSILDPNSAVDWKYKSYNILLEDGRTLLGLITEESSTSIALALPDGTKESILLKNIDEMRNSSKSFMPEGFERTISPEEMADLLEFVKPD